MNAQDLAATTTVLAYPHYPDNPWQRVVYSAFSSARGRVVPLESIGDLAEASAAVQREGGRCVLHLNWTAPISQASPSIADSARTVADAIDGIRAFVADGGRLVWSIHNVLPHELHHFAPEAILCRALAQAADAIVIMNPATPELMAPFCALDPARTVTIEHPSYIGEFADTTTRAEARERLGIADDVVATLFFGLIRPYKGLESLVDAFDALDDPRRRLLVAGQTGPGYTAEEVERMLRPRPWLTRHPGRVPDDEVQVWFAAADLAVLPYRRGLNMSVLLLAASFGTPAIIRGIPGTQYLEGEPWIARIDGDESQFPASLRSAQDALLARPNAPAAARAYAQARHPDLISRRYLELFRGQ